jgi:transposase
VLMLWPTRVPRAAGRSSRARALAAAGASESDIARRTGLSRDALALMLVAPRPATRQKQPPSARLSLFRRAGRAQATSVAGSQVPA